MESTYWVFLLLLTVTGIAGVLIPQAPSAQQRPHGANTTQPNIIFIITDDQDWTLAQWETVPVVKQLIANQGVTMSNYFAHTPICCPSRSEMLSGRFAHNIRDDHFENDWGCNFAGTNCGCMRMNTSVEFHAHNFGVYLKRAGYNTGWFGKYLNYQGVKTYCNAEGTWPPGWDRAHFYCNDSYGLEGIWWNNNGKLIYSNEYSTAVMGNASVAWLSQQLTQKSTPLFMTVAPHAPHEPYTPAPWYANATVPDIPYPRYPWYNHSASDHVPWLAALPPLTAVQGSNAEFAFHQRFRALMAVDDIVKEIFALLEKFDVLNNTFVFFTSDHGHHLGEFRLTEGKEHPYEFDIRVPFAVRGPGIPKGTTLPILTSNVDLAPTFLDLAGVSAPPQMDGQSFAHFLTTPEIWHNKVSKERTEERAQWNREALIIEYYSVANWPSGYIEGKTSFNDCPNNTYRALRFISQDYGNMLYVEYSRVQDWWFQDVNFYELYNVDKDPYQLQNIYKSASTALQQHLHELMEASYYCGGTFTSNSNCTKAFPASNSVSIW